MVFTLLTLYFFWLILNLKFSKSLPDFSSVLLNILFVVSIYSCWITGFKTMFVLPLIGVPLVWYRYGFKISYIERPILKGSFLALNASWFIFFVIYFALNGFELRVSHEDYIIFSRLAFYNDIFGLENTFGFYNLFGSTPQNEVYHFFEMWLINLGQFFNKQGYLINLIFFVFPLLSWCAVLGIKELTLKVGWIRPLCIFLIAIMISSPYDLLVNVIKYPLPFSGVGNVLLYPKHIVIFPIVIFVIKSVRDNQLDYFLISVISFIYPLIIPVLFPALIIYEWWQAGYKFSHRIIYPICFTAISAVLMIMFGGGESLFSLTQLFNFRTMARIAFIGFIIPIFLYSIVYFVFLKRNGSQLIIFLIILLIAANGMWFILQININANQFFSIPFNSILVLLTAISIYLLFENKKYWISFFCLLIYTLPFVFFYNFTKFQSSNHELVDLLNRLPNNEMVIYAPIQSQISNIYSFNERMSLPDISIFIDREDLHIINIAASYPPPFQLDNFVRKATFDFYRKNSPYFKFCGEMKPNNLSCLEIFSDRINVRYLLADSNLHLSSFWNKKGSTKGLTLYERAINN